MKALVFGSMNIDKVYSMPHLPQKGETLFCGGYELHVGGKGLNQAVALKKAGADVYMAGCVGSDGGFLLDFLNDSGVDTSLVKKSDGFTGHAVIEVDPDGQNQMILFHGANHELNESDCDAMLENFGPGDLILMQHETSQVGYMMRRASEKGMFTAINPSPFVDEIRALPLEKADLIILNESEGAALSGETGPEAIVDKLRKLNDNNKIVLTLGGDGAIFADKNENVRVPAFKVRAKDTTCAGDTFTGYFLCSFLGGETALDSMKLASAASANAVMHIGAAQTIPEAAAVRAFLEAHKKEIDNQ